MRARGFTLAEVMVCVLLLAMAVLGLVSVQVYTLNATKSNRGAHTATVISTSVMNDVEHRLHQNFTQSVAQSSTAVPGFDGFQCAVAESFVDTAQTLKQIDTTVFWKDKE